MFALAETAGDTSWWDVLGLVAIPAFIFLNGLFVAAEFALVSVRKTRIEELAGKGVKGARSVLHAIGDLSRSIAATQLGITLASIGLGFVVEPSLARLLQRLYLLLTGAEHSFAAHSVATLGAFLLVTFLHVVFGELIPKTVALQLPDRVALTVARPLTWFAALTRPLILLINGTGNAILRRWGFQPVTGDDMVHSVEELMLLIEDTEEAGILDADQAEFVQNVFHLADKRVRDCMVPRDKMAALELHTPPERVLEAVRSGAHTRMPVYDGDLNRVVGIVNTKDLFHLFSLQGVVILMDALYPALFLRPEEDLGKALRVFRRAKRPMALVRDDGGEILGLITLEDVLEEIVGDIEDEHDQPSARRPPLRRPAPRAETLPAAQGRAGEPTARPGP